MGGGVTGAHPVSSSSSGVVWNDASAPHQGNRVSGRLLLGGTVIEYMAGGSLRNVLQKDCSQAADLLRGALDREHQGAKDLPKKVSAPFRTELEVADAKEKAELGEHLQAVDKLLEHKRELSARAKIIVEQIKEVRAETAAAVEDIREQGKAEILHAQAIWAQGEDTRRDKWMAKRTREIRELTLKGLEPEVERIMDKHKVDMEEAERAHHREAQRLREQTSLRAGEALSEDHSRLRSRAEQARRETMEALSKRRQALMDKHQADLERSRKHATGEAEAQRRWQNEEMRRMEGVTVTDVARFRKEEHDRLQEIRLQHAEDMAVLSRKKAAALASLARQAELDREECTRRAKEEASTAFERENKRLTAERDEKIDFAIRRLQRERREFEESLKAEIEEEAHRLEEAQAEDIRALNEKQARWGERHDVCTDALHSIVESRRELALRSREVTTELDLVLLKVEKAEAETREGAVAARDEETRLLQRHQELMSESRSRRAELEDRVKGSEGELRGIQIRSQSEMSRLREEHERSLERLHREVKEKVENHDEDISTLRELVHTENLRAEHASKMLAKYVKRAAAATADAAAGASDGNGAGLSFPGQGSRGASSRYSSSRTAATSRAR